MLASVLVIIVSVHFITSAISQLRVTGMSRAVSSSLEFGFNMLLQLDLSVKRYHRHKIFFLTASAFSIIAMVYYEGMLTSFMTAKAPTPAIKSFKDIVSLELNVATLAGSGQVTELKRAPDGSGRKLVYEELLKENPSAFKPSYDVLKEFLLEDVNNVVMGSKFSFIDDPRFMAITALDDSKVEYRRVWHAKRLRNAGPDQLQHDPYVSVRGADVPEAQMAGQEGAPARVRLQP